VGWGIIPREEEGEQMSSKIAIGTIAALAALGLRRGSKSVKNTLPANPRNLPIINHSIVIDEEAWDLYKDKFGEDEARESAYNTDIGGSYEDFIFIPRDEEKAEDYIDQFESLEPRTRLMIKKSIKKITLPSNFPSSRAGTEVTVFHISTDDMTEAFVIDEIDRLGINEDSWLEAIAWSVSGSNATDQADAVLAKLVSDRMSGVVSVLGSDEEDEESEEYDIEERRRMSMFDYIYENMNMNGFGEEVRKTLKQSDGSVKEDSIRIFLTLIESDMIHPENIIRDGVMNLFKGVTDETMENIVFSHRGRTRSAPIPTLFMGSKRLVSFGVDRETEKRMIEAIKRQ